MKENKKEELQSRRSFFKNAAISIYWPTWTAKVREKKRLFIPFLLLVAACPSLYAGKFDSVVRGAYLVTKEPEKAFSFLGFLMSLFLMCISVAVVAGIVSIILKSVFDLDKEDTQKAFCAIGGILLAICLIIYFVV